MRPIGQTEEDKYQIELAAVCTYLSGLFVRLVSVLIFDISRLVRCPCILSCRVIPSRYDSIPMKITFSMHIMIMSLKEEKNIFVRCILVRPKYILKCIYIKIMMNSMFFCKN